MIFVVQNMVGPGEVDAELEQETAEECEKYGKVTKCLIFEVNSCFLPNQTQKNLSMFYSLASIIGSALIEWRGFLHSPTTW